MVSDEAGAFRLFQDAPLAAFFLDLKGDCFLVNRRLTAMTGLTFESMRGPLWRELFPLEERPALEQQLAALQQGGPDLRRELRLATTSPPLWMLCSIGPMRDAGGKAYAYGAWLADISERKKVEAEREQLTEQLRASEELNQTVRRIGRFAYWTLLAGEDRPSWSPEMFALWRRRIEDGAPSIEELFTRADPADRPRILAATERLRAGEPDEIEYRFLAFDGTHRWLHAQREALRSPSGEVLRVVGIAQDVTWRHEALRERLERDRFLRGLTLALPEPAFAHDGEKLLFANPAFALLLGWENPEQLIGELLLSIIPSNEHERVLGRARHALAGQNNPSVEATLLRRDGSSCPIELSGLAAEYEGNPAVLQMVRDLSARRAAEERRLVSDREAALATLASGVAHELNNPLAWMQSNVEMIGEGLARLSRETELPVLRELQSMVRDAREGAQRVKVIARDLKTFSSGSSELVPQDPTDALELALRLVAQELNGRCRVVKQYQPAPLVMLDRALLAQAFANLLLNAAQAMAGGDPARSELVISVSTSGSGGACIELADNGPGIPPENLPRVFEPFFTTKPVGTGTGLGLSVVLNSVKSMGGTVTAASEPGQGATFRVLLPRAELPASKPVSRSELPAIRERLPRMLVVDGDPLIGQSLRRLLGRECEVLLAVSAEAAREEIAKSPELELLLCDVLLPGTDGIALYQSLQKSAPRLAGRMIFMSGGPLTRRERAFLADGPRTLIEKPFQAERIRALVREALKRGVG